MQNVEIVVILVVRGHLRSTPKVTGNITIRYSAYDFLFDFSRN